MLHQRHLDFSSGITGFFAFHHWLSKQTDAPVKSSYHNYDCGEDSYFNDDTFEIRCYFNAGNENCHFYIDIFEDGVYFNDSYAEDCYLTDMDPIKTTRKAVSSTMAKE